MDFFHSKELRQIKKKKERHASYAELLNALQTNVDVSAPL